MVLDDVAAVASSSCEEVVQLAAAAETLGETAGLEVQQT